MKTTIDFLNGLPVAKSANFQKNVIKNLPKGINQIYLDSCSMERCSGYGSYNFVLRLEINNVSHALRSHTNDSESFDNYKDLEHGTRNFENWIKSTALMLLDDNKDLIIELIEEEDNE
jgi:hypothetical protein